MTETSTSTPGKPPVFARNVAANAAGRAVATVTQFVAVPAYLAALGLEWYSVIAFAIVLQGIVSIADSGITATLSRELAAAATAAEKQAVFTTLERLYWCICAVIVLAFTALVPYIAEHWLQSEGLPLAQLQEALYLCGPLICLHLLASFYTGGLQGLEKQVTANLMQGLWVLSKSILVVPLLWTLPDVRLFFGWQTAVTLIYAYLLRNCLCSVLKGGEEVAGFSWQPSVVRRVARFSGGMFLIALVAGINTQVDKLMMSKFLSISELGIYTLASSISQISIIIVSPLSVALLPRWTALHAQGKDSEVEAMFQRALRITAVVVFSLAAVLACCATDVMWVWTTNPTVTEVASGYLPLLAFGSALLALQILPFCVAVARGYTRFNNVIGLTSLFFTIPVYLLAIPKFQADGAAYAWLGLQCAVTPVYYYLVVSRWMPAASWWRVILLRVVLTAVAALAIALVLSYTRFSDSRLALFVWLSAVTIATLLLMAALFAREELLLVARKLRLFALQKRS